VLFAVWATAFYLIIIEEINDETDDALEDYSELIITRALAGEELPSKDSGTNNSYYIHEVTVAYADTVPHIRYSDEMIYIDTKKETEPARILKTIFKDKDFRYYELTVLIPTIEKEDLREAILIWIIILYLMLLLVIIFIDAWILYRSFKPLHRTLAWLDNFNVNKELEPLDNETDITEFRKLNTVVTRSAQRNIDAYNKQKMFIGHASHELQTPLAACQNRLELLMSDTDLNEKQLEEILKTKQSLSQIIKLNRTLLLLTKIENNQFPDEEIVNINRLTDKYLTDCSEIYESFGIEIERQEEGEMKVKMNETLASVLIGNLIKNAFVHNIKEGGRIEILITPTSLRICNTGATDPLDAEKVFDYFYHDSKRKDSIGLGLSLVNAIAKQYGFKISYSSEDGKHCFALMI
jgi:Signal transduction histidine kinase